MYNIRIYEENCQRGKLWIEDQCKLLGTKWKYVISKLRKNSGKLGS